MPHLRNMAHLALLTLIVLSGALLDLNSSGAKPAQAAGNAGHRMPNTLDTQATFTVTNANDGDTGSLRIAMGLANLTAGADTIVFDPAFFNTPRTINLASALPVSSENLVITGPGAHLLTIRRDTGGDYRIFTINSGLTLVLSGMTLSNGNAGTGQGGAIANTGDLFLTGCHITGNMAASGGGISSLGGASRLTLLQSTVSNNIATTNQAAAGGGILSGDTLNVINSTISGNRVPNASGMNGGGIWTRSATITNSTITNNSVVGPDSAGGVYVASGLATIRNSIIAGNANNSATPDITTVSNTFVTSGGFNLIGNRGPVTAFSQLGDQSGTGATPLNPLLATLGNFGGTTPVHALLIGSPALDKGAVVSATETDQRGALRRFDITTIAPATSGDNSDIGAVEMQAIIVANADDSGTGSLRQALTDANANANLNDILFDNTFFNTPRTINLARALPDIPTSLTINGPGANLLTVRRDTGGNYRIFGIGGPFVSINNLTISNGNVAGDGGGIADGNPASALSLANCIISGNTASGFGGGILAYGSTTINNCLITGNNAANAGGVSAGFGNLSMLNSTVSGNTAVNSDGGVTIQDVNATLANCTISGNASGTFAGGLRIVRNQLTLTNCTVTGNRSTDGIGGIVFSGTTLMKNTIVAGNNGQQLALGTTGVVVTSLGYNLASDNGAGFLNGIGDQINTNAQLGPLQNNGGPTPTHALLPNSPALDKGNSVGITTDQRGRTRPFDISGIAPATGGDNSDIGAVESQASIVANDGNFAGGLRQVIADAPAGADILFDPAFFNAPRTITLPAGEILINKNLTINGPGANLLTLSGLNLNRVFNISSGVTANLSGLTISNGRVTGFGGGIFNAGFLTLTNVAVVNSEATSGGGGISLGFAEGVFTGCTFSGNKAGVQGGGIEFRGGGGRRLRLINSTVSGNTSNNTGGGIYHLSLSGGSTLEITNSTIANNTAQTAAGGGLYNAAGAAGTPVAMLRNNIIANNTGTNLVAAADPGGTSTITSLGYNLTTGSGSGFLTAIGDQINADPMLGPLANNGGPTQTHALLSGSPAIDKGHGSGSATDQRGVRRPVDDPLLTNATGGDGSDIGAFERTALAVVSASSFKGGPFAQESIVAAFGENLTAGIAIASTIPLPVTLDSTSVMVSDSASMGRVAGLFFVSPGQLNFQIPPGTAVGAATISVLRNGSVVASTNVTIAAVEPSLFTANSSGTGIPAAILYRVRNGNLTTESVAPPIDLGPEGDVTVLVLYGGGIRKRSSLSAVTIKIGGINVAADFAGEAPGFIGLDQINTAVLPRTLAGKGLVNLELTVDGKPANVVTLNFK